MSPEASTYKNTARELSELKDSVPAPERTILQKMGFLHDYPYFQSKALPELYNLLSDSGTSNDWLRSLFYLSFSQQLNCSLVLSKVKTDAIAEITRIAARGIESQHKVVTGIFDNAYFGNNQSIETDTLIFPPVMASVLKTSLDDCADFFDVFQACLDSNYARSYREMLGELRGLYVMGSRPELVKYKRCLDGLEKLASGWGKSLDTGLGVEYKQRTLNLKKVPAIGYLLEFAGMDKITLKDKILKSPPNSVLFISSWYK